MEAEALRRAAELGREWRQRLNLDPDARPTLADLWRLVNETPTLIVSVRDVERSMLCNRGDGHALVWISKANPDPEKELESITVDIGAGLLAAEGKLPECFMEGYNRFGDAFAAAFLKGEEPQC